MSKKTDKKEDVVCIPKAEYKRLKETEKVDTELLKKFVKGVEAIKKGKYKVF